MRRRKLTPNQVSIIIAIITAMATIIAAIILR